MKIFSGKVDALKQPTMFYRYRAFDNFSLDSLCNDLLYFSHPANFNDPFDCNPVLKCDSSVPELEELLLGLIKKRVLKETKKLLGSLRLSSEKVSTYASRRAAAEAEKQVAYIKYMATDPGYEDEIKNAESIFLVKAIEDELRSHYERGICCFSTSYSSSLLWSHYGDHHRGICIGYSTNRIPIPRLRKVVYGGSRVIKTSMIFQAIEKNDKQAIDDLDRDFLLRKSADWEYEDEWRLIESQGLQNSPMLLAEVIFGLRCPSSIIHAVTRALEGRKSAVQFYRIHADSNEYSLKRKMLDIYGEPDELPRTASSPEEDFGSD